CGRCWPRLGERAAGRATLRRGAAPIPPRRGGSRASSARLPRVLVPTRRRDRRGGEASVVRTWFPVGGASWQFAVAGRGLSGRGVCEALGGNRRVTAVQRGVSRTDARGARGRESARNTCPRPKCREGSGSGINECVPHRRPGAGALHPRTGRRAGPAENHLAGDEGQV